MNTSLSNQCVDRSSELTNQRQPVNAIAIQAVAEDSLKRSDLPPPYEMLTFLDHDQGTNKVSC